MLHNKHIHSLALYNGGLDYVHIMLFLFFKFPYQSTASLKPLVFVRSLESVWCHIVLFFCFFCKLHYTTPVYDWTILQYVHIDT